MDFDEEEPLLAERPDARKGSMVGCEIARDRRRSLLVAALGFALLELRPPPAELAPLRRWLDSWAGVGIVVDGMIRQGFDVALTRHGDAEPAWRALFYPAGFLHVSRAGAAWATTPWRAVQPAAWEALTPGSTVTMEDDR
jgi:hypothetical protein